MATKSKEEVVQEFRMQSLQEAAMRVIARRGIAAATMQEIADEAEVSKGTIYLYYKDRDELVEKTFENAIRDLHMRLDTALESDGSFEQRLRGALHQLIGFFKDNGEFFRLYLSHRFPEGSPQQQHRQQRGCDVYRERLDKFAAILASAMETGEIRRMEPQRLALLLTEGANAIVVERVMEQSSPPAEADVDLIMSIIFDGIRMDRSQS
ncbi:MAG: TetR/AcrR family transcriptional regulator [Thermoanaerobaculia bacterium]|nr:TetR/AcrR family transcriptional regulator [Thermoanaerobaculia bacterium]